MAAGGDRNPIEDTEDRRERLRLEGMRSALEQRPLPPPEPQDERNRAGHVAKAGFRGTTMILVVVGILAALVVLSMASKALKLREDPKRPGVGRTR
ncbi:MAG: hypothetical protein QM820_54085 [Minicystis sp.]